MDQYVRRLTEVLSDTPLLGNYKKTPAEYQVVQVVKYLNSVESDPRCMTRDKGVRSAAETIKDAIYKPESFLEKALRLARDLWR